MKRLLLKGGRVLDPSRSVDGLFDVIVFGGKVASIKAPDDAASPSDAETDAGWEVVDCTGLLVVPGLIDIHTHLREPGYEYKETIKTGTEAAVAGGFTTILCMANTEPVNDNASVSRFIAKQARELELANVLPVGAVTTGFRGAQLTEMAELKEAGCAGVSDDGLPIADAAIMRRALEYARGLGLTVISHAEEPELVLGGVMHEGTVSTRLGLKGIPAEAESVMVARDVLLSELTGGKLHIAHVSSRGALDIIRAAKKRGVNVTAEASPHHLLLTDESVSGYGTEYKMNPPLRTGDDRAALRGAVKDGTIDTIATDHAPHSSIEKDVEFDSAANGVVGLETSLGVVLQLVTEGELTLSEVIRAMTINPALAMGLEKGTLQVGRDADITVIDLEREWTVEPKEFKTKGRNTPFAGWELKGRAVRTIVGGRTVYELTA
ncbi:Dihydroorotase [hydrothermal vent metagenome]|uniref:Dihydroorotase n=1 Tax=hydrothermal vent metagenome TaxID=652676 RepID=A0A3B0VX34_9ZZZZ